MTAYQGGKKRIGKKIHDVILLVEDDLVKSDDAPLPYFEPFIGMASVMRHFGDDDNRKLEASDINIDLIMMWNALKKGWKPPLRCSKEKYERLKKTSKHSAERAFIGIVASYGTIFFHNYRLHLQKDGKDFLREGYDGLMKILPSIEKVKFEHGEYDQYKMENYLIYCDPPYRNNNLKSKFFDNFDHDDFWRNMRKWSKKNIVIISESSAPEDFKKIWTSTSYTTNKWKNKKYEDNLYIHEKLFDKLSAKTKKEIKQI
jgi:site-specific DNA-adenine methylase